MVLSGLVSLVLLAALQAGGPPGIEIDLVPIVRATEPPLRLQYHDIRTDAAGMILPWSHDEPAKAFDHVVRLVWAFWLRMEACPNGVPYYLQHQVWKPEHDPRGLGGDQISMALSSWNLLHGYLWRTPSRLPRGPTPRLAGRRRPTTAASDPRRTFEICTCWSIRRDRRQRCALVVP